MWTGPIFKILSPGDPHHPQCVATLPCESRKSKNVTDFNSTSTDC